jgi:hypothetical protein
MKAFNWLVDNKWALEAFDPGKYLLRKYEEHEGWLCQVMSVGFEAQTGAEAERLAPQFMAVADGRIVDSEAAKKTESKSGVVIKKGMPAGMVTSIMTQLIERDVAAVQRLGLKNVTHELGSPDKNGESLLTIMGELQDGVPYGDFASLIEDEFGLDTLIEQK